MAVRDIRLSPILDSTALVAEKNARDLAIERFFSELARETGMGALDFMPGVEQPEECTLVYDKFASRAR
jgi:hypothetical protein